MEVVLSPSMRRELEEEERMIQDRLLKKRLLSNTIWFTGKRTGWVYLCEEYGYVYTCLPSNRLQCNFIALDRGSHLPGCPNTIPVPQFKCYQGRCSIHVKHEPPTREIIEINLFRNLMQCLQFKFPKKSVEDIAKLALPIWPFKWVRNPAYVAYHLNLSKIRKSATSVVTTPTVKKFQDHFDDVCLQTLRSNIKKLKSRTSRLAKIWGPPVLQEKPIVWENLPPKSQCCLVAPNTTTKQKKISSTRSDLSDRDFKSKIWGPPKLQKPIVWETLPPKSQCCLVALKKTPKKKMSSTRNDPSDSDFESDSSHKKKGSRVKLINSSKRQKITAESEEEESQSESQMELSHDEEESYYSIRESSGTENEEENRKYSEKDSEEEVEEEEDSEEEDSEEEKVEEDVEEEEVEEEDVEEVEEEDVEEVEEEEKPEKEEEEEMDEEEREKDNSQEEQETEIEDDEKSMVPPLRKTKKSSKSKGTPKTFPSAVHSSARVMSFARDTSSTSMPKECNAKRRSIHDDIEEMSHKSLVKLEKAICVIRNRGGETNFPKGLKGSKIVPDWLNDITKRPSRTPINNDTTLPSMLNTTNTNEKPATPAREKLANPSPTSRPSSLIVATTNALETQKDFGDRDLETISSNKIEEIKYEEAWKLVKLILSLTDRGAVVSFPKGLRGTGSWPEWLKVITKAPNKCEYVDTKYHVKDVGNKNTTLLPDGTQPTNSMGQQLTTFTTKIYYRNFKNFNFNSVEGKAILKCMVKKDLGESNDLSLV